VPSRIAIFADAGFLAHVTRTFEVGRALTRNFGHEVIFCADGRYAHIYRDGGFEVRPVFTVDRDITMQLARRAGMCDLEWWKDACAKSVESDLALIDELRPDLVVGDMHWSLSTAARARKVPYAAIANGAWVRHYATPIEPLAGHALTRVFGKTLFRALFPPMKRFLTWYYARGYDGLRERFDLPPAKSIYDLIEGDITLLADVPEYMPVEGAPASFRYMGPILWEPDLPRPAWLDRLDPLRPTLYFTMGSTGDAAFFDEAIQVFGGTEYQVLITTGGLAPADILGGAAPPNVFVETYAPGAALMEASDVVVSHGGNGTVYQALSRGVPIIGFPTIFEQEINMQRVCALGAGVRMWRSGYDAKALRRAVEQVLGDSGFRERCSALQSRIARMDGRLRAALHIDQFLRTGDPLCPPDEVTHTIQLIAASE
jgi:MGT family glycosyltransferase